MHQASCRVGSPPNTRPFKVLHSKTYECIRTYALLSNGLFAKCWEVLSNNDGFVPTD